MPRCLKCGGRGVCHGTEKRNGSWVHFSEACPACAVPKTVEEKTEEKEARVGSA
jgi:hypothetical protein